MILIPVADMNCEAAPCFLAGLVSSALHQPWGSLGQQTETGLPVQGEKASAWVNLLRAMLCKSFIPVFAHTQLPLCLVGDCLLTLASENLLQG